MKFHDYSQTDRIVSQTGVSVGLATTVERVLGNIGGGVRGIVNSSRNSLMTAVGDVAMGGGESRGEGEGEEGEAQE